MPRRKFVLAASRGGKVNDEAIREIETASSAPATGMAGKPSNGRAVSVLAAEGRSDVLHEIKMIGRARVLEFQIDPQTGHVVRTAVANDDDGEDEEE